MPTAGGRAGGASSRMPPERSDRIEDAGPAFRPLEAPEPDRGTSRRAADQGSASSGRHLTDAGLRAGSGRERSHALLETAGRDRRGRSAGRDAPRTGGRGLDIDTGSGSAERRITLRGRLDGLTAPSSMPSWHRSGRLRPISLRVRARGLVSTRRHPLHPQARRAIEDAGPRGYRQRAARSSRCSRSSRRSPPIRYSRARRSSTPTSRGCSSGRASPADPGKRG